MIVKVVVKHDDDASWSDAKELYSCNTSESGDDSDPINASAISGSDSAIGIGVWQTWVDFIEAVTNLNIPEASDVSIDVVIHSFPRINKQSSPMMIKQSDVAQMFLKSIQDFVPRLRDSMVGVWIRVD